ncbi:DUF2513 domain-containing protein [Pannonibacter sp. SL95]|uniref:DUF2513 domain-containing protein n=1 Tax=Pannonibacter sp. SL95 TaxID=2995153 RepID=UPI00227285DE|nr:DUF2513 domain-containing protein [Pannonibacter sp. SL95]MCY1706411.1 DUF2513 domain-containing protein [Pannonibacter sp. SL95]
MKRDMDLIRKLLLDIESGTCTFELRADDVSRALMIDELGMDQDEVDRMEHHLQLLSDQGWVEFDSTDGVWIVGRITWAGHDFIDTVRDDEIWALTKSGVSKARGFTFDLVAALAKGLLRNKIEQHTGVKIDL